jgi:5-(aminomethyl)-3-furanmethanol phosphate kinase
MHARAIKGFNDYGIEIVLKFGGSLTRDLDVCERLVRAIAGLVHEGKRIVIVPGGGRTDKVIEALDRERPLGPDTAHRACALAEDQTGLIISDAAYSSGALVPCETLGECREALNDKAGPVLLPSRLLFDLDPIERTWDVTSDAVAAWVAWLVGARRIAILTDVDGIYRNGSIHDPKQLLPEIDFDTLRSMGHTSIDACAADFLAAHTIEGAVLNGQYPERVVAWCRGMETIGTIIGRRCAPGSAGGHGRGVPDTPGEQQHAAE